jgi:hypothetical protein
MIVGRVFVALAVSTLVARSSSAEPRARPLAVSGAAAIYTSVPFAGLDLVYDVNGRLALDAQLMSVVVLHDLSAGARFFFARYQRGGLYLGANAHYMTSFQSDGLLTVSAEAGVEKRSESGVVFGLSLGYMRKAPFDCRCIIPDGEAQVGGLGVLVRVGKAF